MYPHCHNHQHVLQFLTLCLPKVLATAWLGPACPCSCTHLGVQCSDQLCSLQPHAVPVRGTKNQLKQKCNLISVTTLLYVSCVCSSVTISGLNKMARQALRSTRTRPSPLSLICALITLLYQSVFSEHSGHQLIHEDSALEIVETKMSLRPWYDDEDDIFSSSSFAAQVCNCVVCLTACAAASSLLIPAHR